MSKDLLVVIIDMLGATLQDMKPYDVDIIVKSVIGILEQLEVAKD